MTTTLLAAAMAAKRHPCPRCEVRANTACREGDRQLLPLAETHRERLMLVTSRFPLDEEGPVESAEG